MFLVLGLGNPGPRYERTRHNAGFIIIDALAEKHNVRLKLDRATSVSGAGLIQGHQVVLVKPQTYMNLSGESAKIWLKKLKIPTSRMLVIHDDIDFPLGKIKSKFGGGSGGQKGVESIATIMRTRDFHRLRVGVGRPDNRNEIVDYVLSPFTIEEQEHLPEIKDSAINKIEGMLEDINTLSNETNE